MMQPKSSTISNVWAFPTGTPRATSRRCPGSTHGYDVADPTHLNPEIGDRTSYNRWIETLRARGMGHIVDLVPNHMGIAKSANPWWQDVLENGPSSQYASFFDIDWNPLKPELENKVLLPILGDSYGAVLERQQITLSTWAEHFNARYFETRAADCAWHLRPHPRHQRASNCWRRSRGPMRGWNFSAFSPRSSICRGAKRRHRNCARNVNREKEVIKRRLARLTAAVAAGACAHPTRGHDAQRPAWRIQGASIASMRCFPCSPIGSPTGVWRPRKSTTDGFSTSTISRRCGWKIREVFEQTHAFAFRAASRRPHRRDSD